MMPSSVLMLSMLEANGASIPNDAIICADAINARASLIEFLNERNIE